MRILLVIVAAFLCSPCGASEIEDIQIQLLTSEQKPDHMLCKRIYGEVIWTVPRRMIEERKGILKSTTDEVLQLEYPETYTCW